jgi:ubiquitin-like protein Pup
MSEQQHKSTRKPAEAEEQVDTTEVDSDAKAKLDDDVDSILDEIDDVLEENAEEFVRSFVQKGGQ